MKTALLLPVVAWGASLALARPAPAQPAETPPVVGPDRPDACNGIQVVPVGHVQVEGGVTLARAAGSTDFDAGELMVRVPFSARVEARMQLFSFDWSRSRTSTRGVVGPLVDLKWKIFDSEATDFGVIVGTSLPVGSADYRSPHLHPYGVLSLDQTISGKASVTVNAGVAGASGSGATVGLVAGGVSVAFQASERAGLFLEGYGWNRTEPGGPGEQMIDSGLQYLLGNRVMVDARVGVTFGRESNGSFAGLGASFLF